jgi:hypothetical protein
MVFRFKGKALTEDVWERGSKKNIWTKEGWSNSCMLKSFIIWSHPQILLGRSNQGEWSGRGMWHAQERRMHRFRWESPKERDHSEDRGIEGRIDQIGCGGVEWMQLAQDRDWLRALMNTVMNLCWLVPRSYFYSRKIVLSSILLCWVTSFTNNMFVVN